MVLKPASLLLLSISVAGAQLVNIRGVVSDSSTGERIAFANVGIKETGQGAATNISGFYLILNIAPGSYDIVASAVGYQRQRKIITVSGSEALSVNFHLPIQPIEMEEVVVSGSTKRQELDLQTSVHSLDKAQLKKVPVGVQPDILRSIQILPGIVSTSDVNSQFYVRGGSSDQNLILVDGMRLYNPFHAFGLLSTLDPDLLSLAEVHTGAFPVEYGGRLSSVIDLRTRDGNSSRFMGRTNVNFLSSSLNLEGPLTDDIQALGSFRKSIFSNTFKVFLKEQVPLSFNDFFIKVSYKNPTGQHRFSVQALLSSDLLSPISSGDPEYSWVSRSVGVEADLPSGDRLFSRILLSLGEFEQKSEVPQSGATELLSNTVKEVNLWGNATYYTDSQDLFFFGFEFNFPYLEYKRVSRLGEPIDLNFSSPQIAVWMHRQIRGGLLQLDVGGRIEVATLFGGFPLSSALQPRFSSSIDLTKTWKAKASFGRFSQDFITVTNDDDILPIFVPWIGLPSRVNPEQADHYVAGVEGDIVDDLSISFQSYYKNYNSIVVYNRDKIETSEPDYVNARGEAYGGEALLKYRGAYTDLYAAYTVSWVQTNLNGFIYSPRYDRRHTVNLLFSMRPAKYFDVSLRWEFGSGLPFTQTVGIYDKLTLGNGYPDPFFKETGSPEVLLGSKNTERLPTYHRLDLGMTYEYELITSFRLLIGLNVTNLYNRKNPFYFERTTGKRVNMLGLFPSASLTLEFLP